MSVLYHEKQEAALCGLHALNTLLQAPMFTEWDLSDIALSLDAAESSFMAEAGMNTDDFRKYAAEGSGNVSGDGMFSIQVLDKALATCNLAAIPLSHPDVRGVAADCSSAAGFICNLHEHWFAIRPVQGQWWNFNSLLPAPTSLSATYLDAYMNTLKAEGWMIYVIEGTLPQPAPGDVGATNGFGRYFTPEEARSATAAAEKTRKTGTKLRVWEDAVSKASTTGKSVLLRKRRPSAMDAGSDDEDAANMQRAFQASLATAPAPCAPSQDEDEDANLAAAIAASLEDARTAGGAGCSHSPEAPASQVATTSDNLTPSCQKDPAPSCSTPVAGPSGEEAAGTFELGVRLPNGEQVAAQFTAQQLVSDVWRWLEQQGWDMTAHKLYFVYPRRAVTDGSLTVACSGISRRERMLLVKA